jgi:guanylate kinase
MNEHEDQPGLLLVISGPSGVGKTTITRAIEQELGGTFSVSMTTRPKTEDDVEGRDYYFVDRDRFQRYIDAGELLEWAEVFGDYYGTPRGAVQQSLDHGGLVILDIDVQGAMQVKRKKPEALAIFVLPPSETTLLERLRQRRRESEQQIQQRFARAKAEMQQARESGVYDAFITNDRLDRAIPEAVELVRDERGKRREKA